MTSTTETSAETTATEYPATLETIMTGADDSRRLIFSDAATALRYVRREFRGTGRYMRKAFPFVTQRTGTGGAAQNWDIYDGQGSGAAHIGYVSITVAPLANRSAYVTVSDHGRIIAGAMTDGDADSDDIAITVTDIAAEYFTRQGHRKLGWTAPSKLTDAQQRNADNGDDWAVLHTTVWEMIDTARPAVSNDGTVTVHIPECEYCTDHAIVSAWQNFADSESAATEYAGGQRPRRASRDESAIRGAAREYVTAPEWSDMGRCVECAGPVRGERHESARYAYDRLDAAYARKAPRFVRDAAERVALTTDATYRKGVDDVTPWTVTITRGILASGNAHTVTHYAASALAAEDIARSAMRALAMDMYGVDPEHSLRTVNANGDRVSVWPKSVPDTAYVPGYVLSVAGQNVARANVTFRAITVGTLTGDFGQIGRLYRSPYSGAIRPRKVAKGYAHDNSSLV